MFRYLLLAVAVPASPTALIAQEWSELAYYNAQIGPEDMRSSSGQALRTLGGVLQQDRANYHRYGIRHSNDEDDPIFADKELRSLIPALVAAGNNGRFEGDARAGRSFSVGVFVCGQGNTPSVIHLAAPGGDHSGCF